MKRVKTTEREPAWGSAGMMAATTCSMRWVKTVGWFSTAMWAIAQIWQCWPEGSFAGWPCETSTVMKQTSTRLSRHASAFQCLGAGFIVALLMMREPGAGVKEGPSRYRLPHF